MGFFPESPSLKRSSLFPEQPWPTGTGGPKDQLILCLSLASSGLAQGGLLDPGGVFCWPPPFWP